jgi:anti-sigma regulatory factor (Ser/Thr protein kinase)
MCRVSMWDYPPRVESVAVARTQLAAVLDGWQLVALRDPAELLVSELMTNAVLHARTAIRLTAAAADGVFEVAVGDRDSRRPHIQPGVRASGNAPEDGSWLFMNGRGLFLVEQLADEWGVAELRSGKEVWFRLPLPPAWPDRAACVCATSDAGVRLASGRMALATDSGH